MMRQGYSEWAVSFAVQYSSLSHCTLPAWLPYTHALMGIAIGRAEDSSSTPHTPALMMAAQWWHCGPQVHAVGVVVVVGMMRVGSVSLRPVVCAVKCSLSAAAAIVTDPRYDADRDWYLYRRHHTYDGTPRQFSKQASCIRTGCC